jgi:hypothetical protein
MVTGAGGFHTKCKTNQYCHQVVARTRLKGAPDTAWVQKEFSQNETVYFDGYIHGTDVEVQLLASGTAGPSEWSVSIFVLVD